VADAKSILDDMTSDPVYNVLNLCHVWAYLEEGKITSKKEGGEWALQRATSFQSRVIEQALVEYGGIKASLWDKDALIRFGQGMGERLSF
jgi:streptomycin 3"-adenylyltransferase